MPAEQREPCPVCGSTIREFRDSGTLGVRVTVSAVALGKRTPVEGVEADQRLEAETIRGRYRATLDWYVLSNGVWMLQVLNERGEVVEGGLGDNPDDAVLEVYERLIPPT